LNKDNGTVDLHLYRQYLLSVNKETAEYIQRMLSIGPAESEEPMKEIKTRKRRAVLETFDDNSRTRGVHQGGMTRPLYYTTNVLAELMMDNYYWMFNSPSLKKTIYKILFWLIIRVSG
jgi:hypothetical protein